MRGERKGCRPAQEPRAWQSAIVGDGSLTAKLEFDPRDHVGARKLDREIESTIANLPRATTRPEMARRWRAASEGERRRELARARAATAAL